MFQNNFTGFAFTPTSLSTTINVILKVPDIRKCKNPHENLFSMPSGKNEYFSFKKKGQKSIRKETMFKTQINHMAFFSYIKLPLETCELSYDSENRLVYYFIKQQNAFNFDMFVQSSNNPEYFIKLDGLEWKEALIERNIKVPTRLLFKLGKGKGLLVVEKRIAAIDPSPNNKMKPKAAYLRRYTNNRSYDIFCMTFRIDTHRNSPSFGDFSDILRLDRRSILIVDLIDHGDSMLPRKNLRYRKFDLITKKLIYTKDLEILFYPKVPTLKIFSIKGEKYLLVSSEESKSASLLNKNDTLLLVNLNSNRKLSHEGSSTNPILNRFCDKKFYWEKFCSSDKSTVKKTLDSISICEPFFVNNEIFYIGIMKEALGLHLFDKDLKVIGNTLEIVKGKQFNDQDWRGVFHQESDDLSSMACFCGMRMMGKSYYYLVDLLKMKEEIEDKDKYQNGLFVL